MGIIGLTHSEDGGAIQRLPVTVKLAIGLGPDEKAGKNYPQKLDHFAFLTKKAAKEGASWAIDDELTAEMEQLYGGKNLREIEIVFMDDTIENIFRTEYAWWSATQKICGGSLVKIASNGNAHFAMQATRRTKRAPEGEEWPGNYKYTSGDKKGKAVESCGDGCPDLEAGRCKPSGDLLFLPARKPSLGNVWKLHTTSYRSIRNIHAGLQQIRNVTGGRLAGIPIRLKVQPEKVSFEDPSGKKKTSTAHILSVAFGAEDMQKLLNDVHKHAQLFAQTKLLGAPARVEIMDEDEPTRAKELKAEFYADAEEVDATLPDADPADFTNEPKLVGSGIPKAEKGPDLNLGDEAELVRIDELHTKLGHNKAKRFMLAGQYANDLKGLVALLESELDGQKPTEKMPPTQNTEPATTGAFKF